MSHLSTARLPTTTEEWNALLEKVEQNVRSPYSPREKLLLWCQGVIVLLSGILYLISLLRQAFTKSFWCIKKDADGYWRPNVHVAIPLLTITHAATQTTAIGLTVIGDPEGNKVTCVVALNLVACSVLYFAGWTKVWAVLYALPSSIFRLRRRDVLGSTAMITKRRILSPKSFNSFILCGYVAGLFPIPALSYTVYWVQQIIDRLNGIRDLLTEIISQMSQTPQNITPRLILALQARKEAQLLESAQSEALKCLRIFSGIWLAVSFGGLVVFLGGSFALMLALTRQIEILGKIQKQREILLRRRSYVSMSKPPIHPLKNKQITINDSNSSQKSLLFRFKNWIPSISDADEEDPLDNPPRTCPPEFPVGRTETGNMIWSIDGVDEVGAHVKPRFSLAGGWEEARKTDEDSKKNKKRLTSYCVRFAWQTVFCTLIALSYIVLNIFVVFNVFNAPTAMTLSQLFRTIEQWAAWSWGGGPGAILGLLACIVAFSRNPSLPREPEHGPPATSLRRNGQFGDEEDDYEYGYEKPFLHGASERNALTAEKLHMHSSPNPHSKSNFPKLPEPAKTSCASGTSSSWQGLKLKLGITSRPNFSRSSPSHIPPTETSAGHSRTWSSFQIMSLDSSNLVTMQSARPYPLNQFQISSSPVEQSTSAGEEELVLTKKKYFAYHYPTGAAPRSPGPYNMPVQITRSENDNYSQLGGSQSSTPSTTKFASPDVATGGHFEAIHQLRSR